MLIAGLFPHGTAFIGIVLGAYRALYRVPYTVERVAVVAAKTPSLVGELTLALSPFFAGFLLTAIAPHELLFIAGFVSALSLFPLAFVPNVHERFSWRYRDTFGRLAAPENTSLLFKSMWRGMRSAFLYLVAPLVLLFVLPFSALGAAYSLILLVILVTRASRRVPEHSADGGTYLDEYTALKEMGNSLGRLCVAFASVGIIFFLAA